MHRARLIGIAGALMLSASPGTSQTFADAVWSNAVLAVQYCVHGQADGPTRASWFRSAGFAETVERSGSNSDTTHRFAAPADTVTVELYYGEMPMHCAVASAYMGVTQAGQLLDALIPQLFPTYVRREQSGQQTVCVTYEDPSNPIGHVIGVFSKGPKACVENGTVEFYSGSRV